MIGSETGVVALAAFLYLLFQIFKLVLRLLQSTQKDTYVVGYIGIFISVIVSSCVDSFFWASYISKIIWLMLGLIVYEGLDGRYLRNIRGNNHE
jgi:O-antigen ligase